MADVTHVNICSLPDELLGRIFNKLLAKELGRCERVCPRWQTVLLGVAWPRVKRITTVDCSPNVDTYRRIRQRASVIELDLDLSGKQQDASLFSDSGVGATVQHMRIANVALSRRHFVTLSSQLAHLQVLVLDYCVGWRGDDETECCRGFGHLLQKAEQLEALIIKSPPLSCEGDTFRSLPASLRYLEFTSNADSTRDWLRLIANSGCAEKLEVLKLRGQHYALLSMAFHPSQERPIDDEDEAATRQLSELLTPLVGLRAISLAFHDLPTTHWPGKEQIRALHLTITTPKNLRALIQYYPNIEYLHLGAPSHYNADEIIAEASKAMRGDSLAKLKSLTISEWWEGSYELLRMFVREGGARRLTYLRVAGRVEISGEEAIEYLKICPTLTEFACDLTYPWRELPVVEHYLEQRWSNAPATKPKQVLLGWASSMPPYEDPVPGRMVDARRPLELMSKPWLAVYAMDDVLPCRMLYHILFDGLPEPRPLFLNDFQTAMDW